MQKETPEAHGGASLPRHFLWLLGYEQEWPGSATWGDREGQRHCKDWLTPDSESGPV